jgi:ribosomal protein S8E
MPKLYDDDGNEYTPEQVRAATERLLQEESGQGSLGGLAEDDAGQVTPTARRERELNPMNFGDFFSDNVFGGLDAKYVTGKRPMTVFDFATDAIQAYGGEDIGKRNSKLIETDLARRKGAREEQKLTQDIATGRANERRANAQTDKANLETRKLAEEAIGSIFHDVDSDLWEGRMKELEKEHGLQIPGTTRSMMTRWMEKAREAGVSSPRDVLENPNQYDPAFVNRTRHTFALLEKNISEHAKRQADIEQSKAATGASQSEQTRKQTEFDTERSGLREAEALLVDDLASDDPAIRNRARAKLAALRAGGDPRNKVLTDMTGSLPVGGARGIREQNYVRRAQEKLAQALGREPTQGEVAEEVERLRNLDRAEGEEQVRMSRETTAKEAAVAEGLGTLDEMDRAIAGAGFGEEGFLGRLQTLGKQFTGRITDDPNVRTVDAVNSTVVNIARGLGGQRGVLSDFDVNLMIQGAGFKTGDTVKGWRSRIAYMRRVAERGVAELRKARDANREPVRMALSAEERAAISGDPSAGTDAPTPDGAGSKRQLADQWAARINAEPDPKKKAELKAKALMELRR